tara:strand:- start:1169 stop:2458 length:1290 start_codon:yes stop_codon:yes gene_type:complete
MSDYTESELYSIFANVGYEINQGKTLEEIEQEIKQDYGLDIKLDKELSDEFGAIIKYRDEIIHSVRGTDSAIDFLADLNLMTDHPYYSSVISTFFSVLGTYKISKALLNYNTGNFADPNYYTDLVRRFTNEYYETKDFEEEERDLEKGYVSVFDPDLTDDEAMEDILEFLNPEIRRNMKNNYQMKKYVASMIALLSIPTVIKKTLDFTVGTTFREKRVNREFKRFNDAKAKYSNLKMSLTGHSLGSISNDIGRTHNVKSITFNPAPMEHNKKQPHKDSKIYRMENDIVSHFLTDSDKEDTEHIPKHPWYYNLDTDLLLKIHTLNNFLPPKRRRLLSTPTPTPTRTPRPPPRPIPRPPPPPQKVHNRLKFIIKDDVLTRERPIIKIMNEYSAMIEDSLEEFLPNYQQQELGFIHKNKFKHKLKKKYIFSI